MKVTKILNKLYKLEADEGMRFAKNDMSELYGTTLLVPNDNTSKYIEIPIESEESKDEDHIL